MLTIVPFRDEREAVRPENSFIYDFAAAVWTKDIDRAFRLASQIRPAKSTPTAEASAQASSSRSADPPERLRRASTPRSERRPSALLKRRECEQSTPAVDTGCTAAEANSRSREATSATDLVSTTTLGASASPTPSEAPPR